MFLKNKIKLVDILLSTTQLHLACKRTKLQMNYTVNPQRNMSMSLSKSNCHMILSDIL